MPEFTSPLAAEYTSLWDSMVVSDPRVAPIVDKLWANRGRYQEVEDATGVPWPMIAALHNRESDANFTTQLAQGDPLNRESIHVPRGRGPFESWEDGAYDALITLKGLNKVTDWSHARICYEVERYNGFGYRNKGVPSPYLWSFSNHYTRGKYVRDGAYDPNFVDKQCGAIPLIQALMNREKPESKTPSASGWLSTILSALGALLSRFWKDTSTGPAPNVPDPRAEPPWMVWAKKEVGFHETGANHGIDRYIALGHTGSDGDPWCAIFVNAALESVGVPGSRSAMARSFERHSAFVKLAGPAYGAIVTMWRGSPSSGSGHVGFYMGENSAGVVLLDGNDGDAVRVSSPKPRDRITGYFWPKSIPLPKVAPLPAPGSTSNEDSET